MRVAPQERNQPWKSGRCVKKLSDRSYLVETSSETLRRNRQSLKPAPSTSSQSLGRQSKPTTPASTTSFEASPPDSKTAAIAPETQTAPQMKSPEVPAAPKVLRTRTRIVKPQSRYQDCNDLKDGLLVKKKKEKEVHCCCCCSAKSNFKEHRRGTLFVMFITICLSCSSFLCSYFFQEKGDVTICTI